jgi:hypothetical protein
VASKLPPIRRRIDAVRASAERAALCMQLEPEQRCEYARLERITEEVRMIAPRWAHTMERVVHEGWLRSAVLANQLHHVLLSSAEIAPARRPLAPALEQSPRAARIRAQRAQVAARAAEDRLRAEESHALALERLAQISEMMDALRQRAFALNLLDRIDGVADLAQDDLEGLTAAIESPSLVSCDTGRMLLPH